MNFMPTAGFSLIPNSTILQRLKARRRDSCLVASDMIINLQETVTSSNRKLTTICNNMGELVVPFLHYDATKVTTVPAAEATNTKRQRGVRFSLRCLPSSVWRGHDRTQSLHGLGPSLVRSPYARADAGLLDRCHVQMLQKCTCERTN